MSSEMVERPEPAALPVEIQDEKALELINIERAYECHDLKFIEKASRSVDAYELARACVLYGHFLTALKTQHLFPAGTRFVGPYLLFHRRAGDLVTLFDFRLDSVKQRPYRRALIKYNEDLETKYSRPLDYPLEFLLFDSYDIYCDIDSSPEERSREGNGFHY